MDSTLAGIVAVITVLITLVTLGWTISWTVISSRQQARDAKENTRQLNQIQRDIAYGNRLHDQYVQRLYRAIEAVTTIHKAHVYLLEYSNYKNSIHKAKADSGDVQMPIELDEQYFTKHAELSAAKAELRGLAFAIGDQELLDLVNNPKRLPDDVNSVMGKEMEIRGNSQHLHTRISQLLIAATTIGNNEKTPTVSHNLNAMQSLNSADAESRLMDIDQSDATDLQQPNSISHRDSAVP